MPRTKHTARKSTGGTAPRRQLAKFNAQAARRTFYSTAHHSGRAHSMSSETPTSAVEEYQEAHARHSEVVVEEVPSNDFQLGFAFSQERADA